MSDLESREHAIEYDSDFDEEVILNWSDIYDVLLHQQCVFIGLEVNIEIWSQQSDINLGVSHCFLWTFWTVFLEVGYIIVIVNFGNRHDLQPLFELFDDSI